MVLLVYSLAGGPRPLVAPSVWRVIPRGVSYEARRRERDLSAELAQAQGAAVPPPQGALWCP